MNSFYSNKVFDLTILYENLFYDKYIYVIIKFNKKVNGIQYKINKNKLLFIIKERKKNEILDFLDKSFHSNNKNFLNFSQNNIS